VAVYKSLPVGEMVKAYRSGHSLNAVAEQFGASYGTTRRLLIAAGEPLRGAYKGSTDYHLVEPSYTKPVTWSEPLQPAEVDRLRQAVGWKPDWAEADD
jgi:hypothetical protein